jgi:hypothetical protein
VIVLVELSNVGEVSWKKTALTFSFDLLNLIFKLSIHMEMFTVFQYVMGNRTLA